MATAFAPRKILVVDDHPDTAVVTRLMLETEGHKVLEAFDGETALEMADSFLPEVVLADLLLPRITGFEVVRCLRKQKQFDATVMFALSGLGTEDAVERAMESGFDYFGIKPVDPDLLLQSVRSHRPDGLALLTNDLIATSKRITYRTANLLNESRRIQQRSREIMERWNLHHRFDDDAESMGKVH